MTKPSKSRGAPPVHKATPPVKGVPLTDRNSTGEAFGLILRYNFKMMLDWAPVAYKGKDIEGVHQARVSLRRLRSAVGLFRKAIPREITDPWNAEMGWVASAMGAARDLDVFIAEGLAAMSGKIPLESGEKKLMELTTRRRDKAYEEIRAMMDGERYRAFVSDFPKWLDAEGWKQGELSDAVRAGMDKSVRKYAVRMLGKRMSTTLAFGERMGSMTTTELHALRIECKKLRYAFEFFQPLFMGHGMVEFGLHLKGLQDLLGIMNDVTVMHGLLDKLLEGVTDLETIQYAGALIGWRARQYEEVRGQLDARWNEFAGVALPWMK
ncbi:MAG: CHAD domain-containing protein [Magnetococcales bacterium]|nr:CHAD domain-containing protein [Magnetococcales bacterium]